MIDAISQTNKASTVSLIQFSGIKQKEKDYKPGTWGEIGGGLSHYRVQIEPTTLSDVRRLKKQVSLGHITSQEVNFSLDGVESLILRPTLMAGWVIFVQKLQSRFIINITVKVQN